MIDPASTFIQYATSRSLNAFNAVLKRVIFLSSLDFSCFSPGQSPIERSLSLTLLARRRKNIITITANSNLVQPNSNGKRKVYRTNEKEKQVLAFFFFRFSRVLYSRDEV